MALNAPHIVRRVPSLGNYTKGGMTMSKHSAGLWRLHDTIKECIISDTPGQPYSTTICECSGYKEAREANARLIAAAPELLEALQALMSIEVNGHELQDRLQFSTPGRAILDQCRAAINKAKGE